MRNFFYRLLLSFSLCGALFLFKEPISDLFVKAVLFYCIDDQVLYEKSRFQSGALLLDRVKYQTLSVDRVVVHFSVDQWRIVPNLTLVRPEVRLGGGKEAFDPDELLWFLSNCHLEVRGGKLYCSEALEEPLLFSLSQKGSVSVLEFFYGTKILSCTIEKKELRLKTPQIEAPFLLQIGQFFCADLSLESVEGVVEFEALICLDEEHRFKRCTAELRGSDLFFVQQECPFQLADFSVTAHIEKQRDGYASSGSAQVDATNFTFDLPCHEKRLSFFSDNVSSDLYGPLLERFDLTLHCFKDLAVVGSLDADSVILSFSGEDLELKREDTRLFFKEGELSYDWTEGSVRASLPLTKSRLLQEDLELQDLVGTLEFTDGVVQGSLSDGRAVLSEECRLEALGTDFFFDPETVSLCVKDLSTDLFAHGKKLEVIAATIQYTPDSVAFDAEIKDVGSFEGSATLKEGLFSCTFDQTNFFNITPTLFNCTFYPNFSLHSAHCAAHISMDQSGAIFQFFGITLPQAERLSGSFESQLHFEEGHFLIDASSHNLTHNNRLIGDVELHLDYADKLWKVEKLQIEDWTGCAELEQNENLFHVPYCRLTNQDVDLHLAGDIFLQDNFSCDARLSCLAQLPKGQIKIESDKIDLKLDPSTGVTLGNTEWRLKSKEGELLGTVWLKGQEFQFELLPSCATHLLPDFLQTIRVAPLCGSGEFVQGTNLSCKLYFQDAVCYIADRPLTFSEWKISYEDKLFSLQCGTDYASRRFYTQLLLDQNGEPSLSLLLQEDLRTPGLKSSFKTNNNTLQLESINGSFSGIRADLKREKLDLVGTLQIDFVRALPLFPKQVQETCAQLQLGRGYELQGKFTYETQEPNKSAFVGRVLGSYCDLYGFTLEKLSAHMDLSADLVHVKECRVKDAGIQLDLKELKIKKTKDETYLVELPLLSVHNFVPSRLRKSDKTQQVEKPFAIRNLTLEGLRGNLADLSTFIGKGRLHFTNSFKKETSLLELPLEWMRDIGLDLSLLTPVTGELTYQIKEGTVHFTDLKNAYSEGRRSEFFVSSKKPSFMDLSGNLSLDLRFKQNVLLKLAEFFTLTVRGPVDNPEYGLERD